MHNNSNNNDFYENDFFSSTHTHSLILSLSFSVSLFPLCIRNGVDGVESGRLFVWGENQFGQLATGTTDIVTKPSCVKVIKNLGYKVRTIAFGEAFSVILTGQLKLFHPPFVIQSTFIVNFNSSTTPMVLVFGTHFNGTNATHWIISSNPLTHTLEFGLVGSHAQKTAKSTSTAKAYLH